MPYSNWLHISVKDEDAEVGVSLVAGDAGVSDLGSITSFWEDEETRSFYETLPDLKAFIPSILYKDSEKPSGSQV